MHLATLNVQVSKDRQQISKFHLRKYLTPISYTSLLSRSCTEEEVWDRKWTLKLEGEVQLIVLILTEVLGECQE